MGFSHLLVGLGNPGAEYEQTRHNVGFLAVERIAERYSTVLPLDWKNKFSGRVCEVRIGSERCLVLEPHTYMNLSGKAVREAQRFYRIEPSNVLVFHDEADLPFGAARIKVGGGSAGHRGIDSVAKEIGSKDFVRFRLGIGRPRKGGSDESPRNEGKGIRGFVLKRFSAEENNSLRDFFDDTGEALETFLSRDLKDAQLFLHTRRKNGVFEKDPSQI